LNTLIRTLEVTAEEKSGVTSGIDSNLGVLKQVHITTLIFHMIL
jgi:hypothetical protein